MLPRQEEVVVGNLLLERSRERVGRLGFLLRLDDERVQGDIRLALAPHRKEERHAEESDAQPEEHALREPFPRSLALSALLGRHEVQGGALARVVAHCHATHVRAECAQPLHACVNQLAARHRELHQDLPRGGVARYHAMVEVHLVGPEGREAVHLEGEDLAHVLLGRRRHRDFAHQRLVVGERKAGAAAGFPGALEERAHRGLAALVVEGAENDPRLSAAGRRRREHDVVALERDQRRARAAPQHGEALRQEARDLSRPPAPERRQLLAQRRGRAGRAEIRSGRHQFVTATGTSDSGAAVDSRHAT